MTGAIRSTEAASALLTVIMPANNEAAWIGRSLAALLAQDAGAGPVQIIVSANACSDGTEAIVAGLGPRPRRGAGSCSAFRAPSPARSGR